MDSERVKVMTNYEDHTEYNGKLKPEVKTDWLTRLRSGDTKQTTGTLRRILREDVETYGYCCLGVLSDMYVQKNAENAENGENPLIKWEPPNDRSGVCPLRTPEGYSDGMPTSDVNQWAFTTGSSNGWYVYVDEADAEKYERYRTNANTIYLPQMNDAGGSFADIADIIEKYL